MQATRPAFIAHHLVRRQYPLHLAPSITSAIRAQSFERPLAARYQSNLVLAATRSRSQTIPQRRADRGQDLQPVQRLQVKNIRFFRNARDQTPFHRRWKSSTTRQPSTEGQESLNKLASDPTEYSRQHRPLLLDRLPDLSQRFHRPTKEELLAAATGFWSRLRVRFKWFSIRSLRPFNLDDISAFFSWILVGHMIWIIVGTTTFVSLLIFTVNTVFAQETLAGWVGEYLTKSLGVKVVFESAIVPNWRSGVISFKNVFVSRRPGQSESTFKKGSQGSTAAAAAAMAAQGDRAAEPEEEDTNYSQYDLSIETVNVTLSFTKWFNGKGLLRDVEINGVRGVIDRTLVHELHNVDPRSYKYQHTTGDFELESFRMEDFLVSVHQPGNFRPFSVSIFSADLPQLRKQWLFYDLLCANHMSGVFDDSPFFLHPRQTHNQTGAPFKASGADEEGNRWKKHSRIRIDGLNIDHLNSGVQGPFGWIREGSVDIVADVLLPDENDESIAQVVSGIYDRVGASVLARTQSSGLASTPATAPAPAGASASASGAATPLLPKGDIPPFMIMDLRLSLHDVYATVPLFTQEISYVNNALIRPIVAYINSKRAFIPISCRVVKPLDEFDGSWTVYDSGLMEELSRETYTAFESDVVDDRARMRRFRKVGLWSLELAVKAFFLGLAGNMAIA